MASLWLPSNAGPVTSAGPPEGLGRPSDKASVLANSYTGFELIIVDQSTDSATREAMAAIADERLRYAAIEAGNGTGLVSILSSGMLFVLAVR
jgi:hypothetical protein